MSNTRQRRILEAMAPVGPVMQPQVGIQTPNRVHQCDVCAGFIVTVKENPGLPESCPHCGATPLVTTDFGGLIRDLDAREPIVAMEPTVSTDLSEEAAEEILDEALDLLESGDADKFRHLFADKVALNSNNELVAVVESAVARRRTNATQRNTYRLSEKVINESKINKSRLKAIRLNTFMIREAKNMLKNAKLNALYEGVERDAAELEDKLETEIKNADYANYIEDILDDEKLEKELAKVGTEDENEGIVEIVEELLNDEGIEVIKAEVVDEDADATVVSARVVETEELEDLEEFDKAVGELVESEVDTTVVPVPGVTSEIVDLSIVIKNADSVVEDALNKKYDSSIVERRIGRRRAGRRSVRSTVREVLREQLNKFTDGEIEIAAVDKIEPEDLPKIAAEVAANDLTMKFDNGTVRVKYDSREDIQTIIDVVRDVTGREVGPLEEDDGTDVEGTVVIEESRYINKPQLRRIKESLRRKGFSIIESAGAVEVEYLDEEEKEEIIDSVDNFTNGETPIIYEEDEDDDEEGTVVIEESRYISRRELRRVRESLRRKGYSIRESAGAVEVDYYDEDEKEDIIDSVDANTDDQVPVVHEGEDDADGEVVIEESKYITKRALSRVKRVLESKGYDVDDQEDKLVVEYESEEEVEDIVDSVKANTVKNVPVVMETADEEEDDKDINEFLEKVTNLARR